MENNNQTLIGVENVISKFKNKEITSEQALDEIRLMVMTEEELYCEFCHGSQE